MYSLETTEKTAAVKTKKADSETAVAEGGLEVPNSSLSAAGAAGAAGAGDRNGGAGPSLEQGMRDKIASHFGDIQGVKVHYNSSMPGLVDAEAYTRGDDIFLAPGQERHLPHELGHVVQQRRGSVPTTERLAGMDANTDPALEHEADVLGRQFQGVLPDTGMGDTMGYGPVTTAAPTVSAPVQMAGHKGVMIFGNGKIMKRIERNEFESFQRVRQEQNSEDPEVRSRSRAAFPVIHQVEHDPSKLSSDGYDPEKFRQWMDAGSADDYYVEMESLGGSGVSIKDFKVGTTTANAKELYAHRHKGSEKKAMKKQKRMNGNDDLRSETGRYGLRDSDAIQHGINPVRKFLAGQNIRTLESVRRQVKGRHYPPDSPVIQDLEAIENYFEQSDTVYIASSVIVQWHDNPDDASKDRARLIDLAHPFSKKDFPEDFEEIKKGMLLGIRNVKNLLTGNKLQTADEKAAADQAEADRAAQNQQAAEGELPPSSESSGEDAASQVPASLVASDQEAAVAEHQTQQNTQAEQGSGSSAEEETAVDAGTGGGGASAAAQGGRRRGGFMNWLRRLFRRR